jgi:signal transduction histidine kinase
VFAALLSLVTIFTGSFMAELFTRPILHLAYVASKLRKGDFSARAKIWTHDEIGQLGQAFNAMASDLAKEDQAKSDVIALISHQLRTPVTAVKGFVSLLIHNKNSRISDDDMKKLHLAFLENEKLNKLITQILEVAHADSGKLTIKPVDTDITQLVNDVQKEFKPMLAMRQQKLKIVAPATPVHAAVDVEKIRFVLDILLTNASKYSPENTTVTMHISQTKNTCRLEVDDKGYGIGPEDQTKLFQKFSRIENANSATSEGVGLGLYMAKKIVALHGGTITVSSSVNHGSRFTIELPTNT